MYTKLRFGITYDTIMNEVIKDSYKKTIVDK